MIYSYGVNDPHEYYPLHVHSFQTVIVGAAIVLHFHCYHYSFSPGFVINFDLFYEFHHLVDNLNNKKWCRKKVIRPINGIKKGN